MWRKREPLYTDGGNVICCSHYGKQYGGSLNWKIVTIWSSNSTPGHISKENKNTNSKRYMHPNVHSSTIYNSQDMEATQVPVNRWLDYENIHVYMWYIYHMEWTVDYYSAIKSEILPFAATWMDLENIMLSEIRQTKTNTVWYHLYMESKR